MSAKDLLVRPITPTVAREFIRRVHYSHTVTPNSQLHFGVFYSGRLEGAMSFGPPLDRAKILPLVRDSAWVEVIELNRLAFTEALPRNSESRALAVVFRLIRRFAPQVKWVISFADGTQCGDGAIYRAAGFLLTQIKPNLNLARLPNGEVIHMLTLKSSMLQPRPELGGRSYVDIAGGYGGWPIYLREARAELLQGFQLRYLYFLDPAARARLTVPVLPYSAIAAAGASMYRGERKADSGRSAPAGRGGANPTRSLQSEPEEGTR